MSELGGLVLLVGGLAALTATGALAACCFRLRSSVEFVLAVYLLGWTWLVAASLALSPARLLTRGWLLLALLVGLVAALGVWLAVGRPHPPPLAPALSRVRDALRNRAVLVLGVAVALGTVYLAALAFFTPANDWDALTYHAARASLWKQEHGIGYLENTPDARLNANPPNAEIGQLATMLLAGSDRYLALPQLLGYAALFLGVAGLARRIGLGTREAVFGALAFATLPVIVLQASGALNDLVLASFLVGAAVFARGAGLASLPLMALAIALAIGAKFTGLLALPTLALVAITSRPPRRWPGLSLAACVGLLGGSVWYLVNAVETGHLDGGAAEELGQRAGSPGATSLVTAMRHGLSLVDMTGAPWGASLLFLVGAVALGGAGLGMLRRSRPHGRALLLGAAISAGVIASPLLHKLGVRVVYKTGLLLDAPLSFLEEVSWELNTRSDPTLAWYGPLAPVLLVAGTAAVFVGWRRHRLPGFAMVLATAPWVLIATLALTITWDPWRGRFIAFGIALAAATWGVLLRSTAAAWATVAIGSTSLFLTLGSYESKPSGVFAEPSIWGSARWETQTEISGSPQVLRFVEEQIPEDSSIGLALPGDHQIHPYFGPRLSRHVSLIPRTGGSPPSEAEWLVAAPGTQVRRCSDAWKPELRDAGWSVERRVAPDACLSG